MGLVTNNSNNNNNNNQTPSTSASPSTPLVIPVGPHDLQHLPHYDPQTPCSGCGLKSSGVMFTCKTVTCSSKYLHRSCAEFHQACGRLPKSFTHSSHSSCPLSMTDFAHSGRFVCNGCSQPGDRWSYHCARCQYNLHINCVIKPLSIRHQAHSSCELHLSYRGPYPHLTTTSGFLCNVCNKVGSNQWRYRCNSCDFDIHMDCAAKPPQIMKLS